MPDVELFGGRLAGLELNLFALVPNPLPFVRFGLAKSPHLSRELADPLLVTAANDDVRLIGTIDLQVARDLFLQLVGKTDRRDRTLLLIVAR